jgi:hypothetical protein
MKKFVYLTFMLLLFFGCKSKKFCQKYPDAFINAYMPYQLNDTLKFTSNDDIITFVCEEVKIYDNYTVEYGNDILCDCAEPSCLPNYIRMEGINIKASLNYEIGLPFPDEMIEIYTKILLQNTNNDDYIDGYILKTFQTTPFADNVFDILGDTVILEDNREDNSFYQLDIVRNKGIYAFYEKLENGDTRKWELVE